MHREILAPKCSSEGRLFDAISALCGLSVSNEFEGLAALALEFAASPDSSVSGYSLDELADRAGQEIDWAPLMRSVVNDFAKNKVDDSAISRRFHLDLADLMAKVSREAGCRVVALTGGCFQNALLLELAITKLSAAGFRPIWHRKAPPEDGGLAFGQAVIASRLSSPQTD